MSEVRTDEELVKAFVKKNDSKAFAALMHRYSDRLFSYIVRKISNRKDAEDVYQETWLKIARALPAYKEEGKFVNYLFFIATNSAYDHLRHIKRENDNIFHEIKSDDDENRIDFLENIADYEPNPEQITIHEEEKEKVEELIQSLPDKQKEVVLLRSEGMTFQEISDLTGTPLNSLLSRMRYAVEKIQAGITGCRK